MFAYYRKSVGTPERMIILDLFIPVAYILLLYLYFNAKPIIIFNYK